MAPFFLSVVNDMSKQEIELTHPYIQRPHATDAHQNGAMEALEST